MVATKAETANYVEWIRSIASGVLSEELTEQYIDLLMRDGRGHTKEGIDNSCIAYSLPSDQYLIEKSALIYKLSQNWPFRDPNSSKNVSSKILRDKVIIVGQLYKVVYQLTYRNSFELFERLKPEAQFHVYLLLCRGTQLGAMNCYLSMLVKTDLNIDMSCDSNGTNFVEFIDHMRDVSRESSVQGKLTVSWPKSLLRELMGMGISYRSPQRLSFTKCILPFGNLRNAIILLFIAYYGEELVAEAIDRILVLDQSIEPDVMMEILDDWDVVKDYPADWIVQTKSL